MPMRVWGLRRSFLTLGTATSLAIGCPWLALTISSPAAARSTSDESWFLASYRLKTLVMEIWPTWPNSISLPSRRSNRALDHHLLDLGDRFRRVQVLGARLGAVHDGVAAVEPER